MEYNKKIVGSEGEQAVVNYLRKNRCRIIEQNYRCKCGEIDIIAKDREYTVFIEVKTRKNEDYGEPSEAVNYYKKRKIIQVANYYMMCKNEEIDVRFDVIEVFGEFRGGKFTTSKINHIKNAFQT